jgi:hypothetical protein
MTGSTLAARRGGLPSSLGIASRILDRTADARGLDDSAAQRGAGGGAAGARQGINGNWFRPLDDDDGQPGDDHRQSYFGDDGPNTSQSQLERTIERLCRRLSSS